MTFNKEEINVLKNFSKINDQCTIYSDRIESISEMLDCLGVYEFAESKECDELQVYSLKQLLKVLKVDLEVTVDDGFISVGNDKFKTLNLNVERNINPRIIETYDNETIIPQEDFISLVKLIKENVQEVDSYNIKNKKKEDFERRLYNNLELNYDNKTNEETLNFKDLVIKLPVINEAENFYFVTNKVNLLMYVYNKMNSDLRLYCNGRDGYFKITINESLSYYFVR